MIPSARAGAALALAGLLVPPASAATALPGAPAAFDVAGRAPLMVVRAEGAQVYECKADAGGRKLWVFREPIATLIADGRTVGRHYAGPTWGFDQAGVVTGRLVASAPGATPADIPLLKLAVVDRPDTGPLKDTAFVLRLGAHGGRLEGACGVAGQMRAEPYSADYVFVR
jgi:hypothetical protein